MQTFKAVLLCALGFGLGLSLPSAAMADEEWQYEVTPYFFAAGLDGTLGVRDHTTDIDVPFSDIWDSLQGAFTGIFTARNGPWMLSLEGFYLKLEEDAAKSITLPGGNVSVNGELDATSTMYIYQGTVGYRLLDDKTKLYAFGGLRYTKLKADIDINIQFTPPAFGGSASASGSRSWTDAVVGMHVTHPLSENVDWMGYADIGGSSDDDTYQLMTAVNWEFSKGYKAKLGYRLLSWDYEDDGAVWDIEMSGPFLGLGISF